jgi:uncharacterized protein YdiU (UPF0061 family)
MFLRKVFHNSFKLSKRFFTISKMENITSSNVKKFNWMHSAIGSLPIDTSGDLSSRKVRGYNYSTVIPTPVENPSIVSICDKIMHDALGVHKGVIMENHQEWAQILSGNQLLEGSKPLAHCYCGHQFGYFAGQLGDGRAITLGDIKNEKGDRWEIQLKGAGKTPYSRHSDGRAVLRSSIREYLCSEAMHALGIATTRAGSIITSDSTVVRDLLYDGNQILEDCTVVLRLSPTFLRFGSFEICLPTCRMSGTEGPSSGLHSELIPQLYDYTIENFYPEFWARFKNEEVSKEEIYLEVLGEITRRTAETVAKWQGAGFCHGVLNTDNMSILGLTIDFGPFGFMDHFNPDHICNHSDKDGRYSYDKQPSMCKWNLLKLSDTLKELIPKGKDFVGENFDMIYTDYFLQEFKAKLGIQKLQTGDLDFIKAMYAVMKQGGYDWTLFFRNLHLINVPESDEKITDLSDTVDAVDLLFSLKTNKEMK